MKDNAYMVNFMENELMPAELSYAHLQQRLVQKYTTPRHHASIS